MRSSAPIPGKRKHLMEVEFSIFVKNASFLAMRETRFAIVGIV
jgi:hypothetical protein